jgi:hypothetical protein
MSGSRNWLKWLGIGCGGLIVLVAVFIAVILLVVQQATAGPEQVVRAFLSAAAAGDYARAHDAFSAPLKDQQSLETFTAAVRANPSLFSVKDLSFSDRSIDLTEGAKLGGTATLASGTQVPVSFHLVKEKDTWKLISYHLGPKD